MRKLLRVFSCYVWQTMSNSLWQRAVNNGLFSSQVVSWRLLWHFNTLVQRLRVILLFCSEQITRSLFLMLVFLCHGIVYVLAALNSPMPNAVNASDKTGSNKNDVANKCWKQVMAEVGMFIYQSSDDETALCWFLRILINMSPKIYWSFYAPQATDSTNNASQNTIRPTKISVRSLSSRSGLFLKQGIQNIYPNVNGYPLISLLGTFFFLYSPDHRP